MQSCTRVSGVRLSCTKKIIKTPKLVKRQCYTHDDFIDVSMYDARDGVEAQVGRRAGGGGQRRREAAGGLVRGGGDCEGARGQADGRRSWVEAWAAG